MQLLVLFFSPLSLYISLYCFFSHILPDSSNVISTCPKLPSPELFFYKWSTFKHLFCRQTFYHSNKLSWTISWHWLNHKMYMILVSSYFQKFDLVSWLDFQAYFSQDLIDLFCDYYSTILCWEHNVINQNWYIVTFLDQTTHSSNLITPQSGRGIRPF